MGRSLLQEAPMMDIQFYLVHLSYPLGAFVWLYPQFLEYIYIYSYYKGFCWGGLKHSNKPDCCWWIPLNTVCVWQIIQDNHHSDFWRTSPAVLEHMTFPCSLTPLSITLSRKSVFPHVGLENIQWFVAPSRFTTGGNSILGSLNNVIFHRIPVINGEHP